MKRLLIIPLLALAACGANPTTSTPTAPAPTTTSVALDRNDEETAEWAVSQLSESTMRGFCAEASRAMAAGVSKEAAADIIRDNMRDAADQLDIPVDTLGAAMIEWCLDHGYE